jgi:formylglycine-generating enzyme required for sulfatase activity/energy-coupling factor transporter ATP-binding protein EcfA2
MSDANTDDLLARLQALTPEERARILAQLGLAPNAGVHFGGANVDNINAQNTVGGDMQQERIGSVVLSDDARVNGVAVGVNLGTVVYRRDPSEDERRRLTWYLARLIGKLSRLPLRGLEERLDNGEGVSLASVYVELAARRFYVILKRGKPDELVTYFKNIVTGEPREEFDPNLVLPRFAVAFYGIYAEVHSGTATWASFEDIDNKDKSYSMVDPSQRAVMRRALIIEQAATHEQLILLGEPGSGKSTFLRHFAWILARRGLDQNDATTELFRWPPNPQLLPIILPLRTLSHRIAVEGSQATTVFASLCAEMHAVCMHRVEDLLSAALDQGNAILLLDGLDEIPVDEKLGVSASRLTTLTTIRDFVQLYSKIRVIVSCRTRAFDGTSQNILNWRTEEIAPLTLGQVRHFVRAWYGELVAKGQITSEQAKHLIATLIDSIVASPRLTAMSQTPLLLTMMALVLLNKGELPRDRPQLYERILALLLGTWDQVRGGQSLADAVGLPDWGSERFQPLLDQLSYDAHKQATSQDGRGQLDRSTLRDALIAYFEQASVPDAWGRAKRCLDYFEQRSGLLAPDSPDSYVFAHLTLQEHCAGRHIAFNSEDPVALAMYHRADDRWREPIFLGAGLLHPAALQSLLSDLIDREEGGNTKEPARWYRDLILAAEIAKDRDWNYLRTRPMLKVDRLQRDLREGFVALLGDKNQPLPVIERVRVGFLLGELGDPRFPVTIEQWQAELERALAGDSNGYFCRVEVGEYIIGSSDEDPNARESEKPQHRVKIEQLFLIARYPITNAQWQAWVAAGGESPNYENDNDLNHPNQPVVGVMWEMASRFNVWLSTHMRYSVRLPSEYEWEAAARGGDARRYPWGDDWRDDAAATYENEQVRGNEWVSPIGCFPAGAAPCGALDIAGNVWEWTSDQWRSYPGATKPFIEEDYKTLRGGSYYDDGISSRCGARVRLDLNYGYIFGFRIVIPL